MKKVPIRGMFRDVRFHEISVNKAPRRGTFLFSAFISRSVCQREAARAPPPPATVW